MALIKDLDDRQMPLLDHLIELRNRLIYACAAIFLGFLVCYFFAEDIYAFLVQPLADIYQGQTGRRMIYTGLAEAFFTYLKVAFWAGAFLTFPFVATQLWLFIAPGLYKTEKKAFLPFLVATPILFFMGGAMVYYLIFPLAWRFFLSFETPAGEGVAADRARGAGRRVPVAGDEADLRLRPQLPAAGRADADGAGRPDHRGAAQREPQVRDRRGVRRRGDHHPAGRDQPGRARDPDPRSLRDLNPDGANGRAQAGRGRGGRGGGRGGRRAPNSTAAPEPITITCPKLLAICACDLTCST